MIGSDWEWEYYSESDDDEHRSLYVYAEDWQLCKKQAFKRCVNNGAVRHHAFLQQATFWIVSKGL